MDGIVVKLVETEEEMEAAIGVRFRVFVTEQSVPAEEELDDADATATHCIALHQGQVVGTGRLVHPEGDAIYIGRMAVDLAWRRQGIGSQILRFLEEEAKTQGMQRCILDAQEYVKAFYAAHGYQEHGDTFLEVDIPHIEMGKEI